MTYIPSLINQKSR